MLRLHYPRNNTPIVAVALIFVTATGWDYFSQTRMQVELSEEYAGNQVRLARWVEEHWPEGSSVLCAHGEIAHLYLAGRPSGPRALDWLQHAPRDSPEALGAWLGDNQVALVLWFHEEWTGSQEVAGFLAEGGAMRLSEEVEVEPIGRLDRTDGAGFTAFQVRTKDPDFNARVPAPTLRSAGAHSQ